MFERALHVLIHDIRTPVGVAQGYLRLLQEDRLPTAEDKQKAIAGSRQALEQVWRLCADAAAFASGQLPVAAVPVPCDRFVGRVRARLDQEPVELSAADPGAAGTVAVAGSADALADAVARVLMAAPPDLPERRRTVTIGATAAELWFTSGQDHRGLSGDALDPWRGSGFSLPLACQIIHGAGGRVWSAGPGRAGTGVALPLEANR